MKNKVFWFNFFAIIRWVSSLQLVKIYSNNSVALQRGITLTEPNMTQFNNALMFDHFGRTQWFIVPTEEPWLNSSSLWRQQNDDDIWNDRFKNPLCNETSSSDKKCIEYRCIMPYEKYITVCFITAWLVLNVVTGDKTLLKLILLLFKDLHISMRYI